MAADGDEDFSKLSLEERIVHKNWKARFSAYEALQKQFAAAVDDKDPIFAKYSGYLKNFVTESNVFALEKGLDAFAAFLTTGTISIKVAGNICPSIVQKCLGSTKKKIVEKAQEVLMLLIELEKQEAVLNALIEGTQNKNPKVISGSLATATAALQLFGAKVITVKSILKVALPLLEHRDKDVRENSKIFIVECYKWCGSAFKSQLESVKPILLHELEAEFSKFGNEVPFPTRYFRSQVQATVSNDVVACESSEPVATVVREEVDAWEFLDPVNVVAKLPSNFFDQLKSSKWLERKEILDMLATLIKANPRLDPSAQYGDIVSELKNIINKDSNVNVVTAAGKCLAGLALGLRKKFAQFAAMCIPVVLGKFKEKKATVVSAMVEAIDAIAKTVSLDSIIEDINQALSNKNPGVKVQTALFLTRYFASTAPPNKKNLKLLIAPLVKAIGESDVEVRDAAAAAIGTLLKAVGESTLKPFITEIADDHLKMNKIKEFSEKCSSVEKQTVMDKPSVVPVISNAKACESAPVAQRPTAATAKARVVKPVVKETELPQSQSKSTMMVPAVKKIEENELTDEDSAELVSSIIKGDVLKEFESSIWKDRLAALESINTTIRQMEPKQVPVQAVVRFMAKKKEANFQILNLKFELYAYLATYCQFGPVAFRLCLAECLDKIADPKHNNYVSKVLSACAEALTIHHVADEVLRAALEYRNPKTQSESFSWLSSAIQQFGPNINVTNIVDFVKKGLGATSPVVRSAAIELVGILHWYIGSEIGMLFKSEKPAVLQMIETELKKYEGREKPVANSKQIQTQAAAGREASTTEPTNAAVVNDEEAPTDHPVTTATTTTTTTTTTITTNLLPRQDISEQITDALLAEMEDKNWKVRLEALGKVQTIISEAKLINGKLAGLPSVLKQRLADSNKNLSQSALNICQLIATSGGPTVREHVRIIVPGVIGLLSDSKPAIRQNALSVLNCWVEKTGIKELLTSEIIPNALTSDSPILRAELLAWLNGKLETYQYKLPDADLKLTVPLVYGFVEDRNPEVRKQAQNILLPLTRVLGYDFMKNAASKLKPTSVNQIQTLLEKIRPNVIQRAITPDNPEVEVCSESVKRVCGRGNPSVTSGRAKASVAQSKEAVKKTGNTEAVVTSSSCHLIDATSKQQRFQDEKNLKLLKWQFSIPSPDHVEQLKSQLSVVCKPELLQLLFNVDFKLQLKAVEMLSQSLEQNNELAFNCMDLILKWCTLRFFETNPSVLMRCLDLIQSLLQMCVDRGYKMHDLEVASFLPYLLMKLGDQKDAVRTAAQNLVGIIASLSSPCKIFPYLIESCKVKNSRQRAQCLMLMGSMISTGGLSVCGSTPQVALKAIAAYIGDRDKYVRDAALNTLVSAHLQAGGEKLFKFLSNLNSKDRSMLEERIKRSSRASDDNNRTSEYFPVTATSTPLRSAQIPVSTISARNHGQSPEIERKLDKIFPLDFKWNVEALGFDPDENISLCSLELIEEDVDCTPFVYEFKAHKYESKIIDQSIHISAALDAAIRQIISSDLSSSTLALLQLREIVKDEMKRTLLHGRIDSLYTAIADQLGQLREIYNNEVMKQDDQAMEDFYRSVVTILLDIISVEELSKEISPEVQKNLLMQLLATLSFAGMNSLPESSNIQSSINLYGIKMMELYDPTKCVCALISLLRDTLRDGNNKADIRRCVLRCLWKWGRLLPTFVNKLDLSPVLVEIHDFFNEFSSSKCCNNNDESMAFKTMKTILHELGKQFGVERLLKQIDDEIENSANGEDVKILQKLRQCCKDSSSTSDGSSSSKTHQSTDSAIEDVSAQVKRIVGKIGDAATFREGIVELHYFVEKNKNFNLQPHLKQFGIELRNHIQRCLDNLSKNPSTVANYCDTSMNAGEKSNWDANSSRGDLKKHVMKLNQLREKYGLSVLEVESNAVTTSPERLENSSSAFSADNTENSRKASESEKIESLKKRFEAIKKSLNIE
ncbi:Cytoskeleton-associated protein 5 [Trichinella pseudospiralis]|uniref:Cytoskeleton-associated protein 5 n=4 Tax=Trichinella pseudospiralis TaxID=6337 RepID=A0A0V1KDM4_TRIPS|nr:Cytoskeleton-associated protein 5 [Trichinella pseudospiralis]